MADAAPAAVVDDDGDDGKLMPHEGVDLLQIETPSAVANEKTDPISRIGHLRAKCQTDTATERAAVGAGDVLTHPLRGNVHLDPCLGFAAVGDEHGIFRQA